MPLTQREGVYKKKVAKAGLKYKGAIKTKEKKFKSLLIPKHWYNDKLN